MILVKLNLIVPGRRCSRACFRRCDRLRRRREAASCRRVDLCLPQPSSSSNQYMTHAGLCLTTTGDTVKMIVNSVDLPADVTDCGSGMSMTHITILQAWRHPVTWNDRNSPLVEIGPCFTLRTNDTKLRAHKSNSRYSRSFFVKAPTLS